MLITRRQFIKGTLAALTVPWGMFYPGWANASGPEPCPALPGTPWGFDGAGLVFPAYFLTEAQREALRKPYRVYLPIVSK